MLTAMEIIFSKLNIFFDSLLVLSRDVSFFYLYKVDFACLIISWEWGSIPCYSRNKNNSIIDQWNAHVLSIVWKFVTCEPLQIKSNISVDNSFIEVLSPFMSRKGNHSGWGKEILVIDPNWESRKFTKSEILF